MLQQGYSRPVRVVFLSFFTLWTAGGVAFLAWLLGQMDSWRKESDWPYNFQLPLFMAGAVLLTGIAGIVHVLRKRGRASVLDPETTARLNARDPSTNLIIGGVSMAIGLAMTILTAIYPVSLFNEDYYSIFAYGPIFIGAVEIVFGLSQLWRRARARRLQNRELP